MTYTIIFGSNRISNCNSVVKINDREIFRIRERASDGKLIVDFEIRNPNGEIIYKVAKNNVVVAIDGYEIQHGSNFSRVTNISDKSVLIEVIENKTDEIEINGNFSMEGFDVIATSGGTNINSNQFIGNVIDGCGSGITINADGIGLG